MRLPSRLVEEECLRVWPGGGGTLGEDETVYLHTRKKKRGEENGEEILERAGESDGGSGGKGEGRIEERGSVEER